MVDIHEACKATDPQGLQPMTFRFPPIFATCRGSCLIIASGTRAAWLVLAQPSLSAGSNRLPNIGSRAAHQVDSRPDGRARFEAH